MEGTQYQMAMLEMILETNQYPSWCREKMEDQFKFTHDVPKSTIVFPEFELSPRKKYCRLYEKYLADNAAYQVRLRNAEAISANWEKHGRIMQATNRRQSTRSLPGFAKSDDSEIMTKMPKLQNGPSADPLVPQITPRLPLGTNGNHSIHALTKTRQITERMTVRQPTMSTSDSAGIKQIMGLVETLQMALDDTLRQLNWSFMKFKEKSVEYIDGALTVCTFERLNLIIHVLFDHIT